MHSLGRCKCFVTVGHLALRWALRVQGWVSMPCIESLVPREIYELHQVLPVHVSAAAPLF